MKKVLVLSSHLDDAILSCGSFIAGRNGNVDVLTVFSGIPMEENLLTDYDKSCGFNSSKDAMVIRRQEDTEACAILNATPYHTDLLDSQYNKQSIRVGFHKVIENAIYSQPYEMILAPLGLRHQDHIMVSEALFNILPFILPDVYLYEDLPHRVTNPELVFRRLTDIGIDPYSATPSFIGDGPIADKVRALWCYKSQMNKGDLNPYNLYVPERFWKA